MKREEEIRALEEQIRSLQNERDEAQAEVRRLRTSQAEAAADTLVQTEPPPVAREVDGRLYQLIEQAPVAIAMFDRKMRYISASRRWRSDYGLGARDLHGISHYEVFPEISEAWKAVHRRGLAGETVKEDEDRFERADGSVQWLRWEVQPWQEASGAVGGIIIFTEDITGRKQAELAIRDSEERFRSTFEQAAVGMAHADSSGRFLRVNNRFCEITGYAREELLQKGFSDISYPEDVEAGEALEKDLLSGGCQHYWMEKRYVRKDGTLAWVDLHVSLVRDADGIPRYSLGVVEDISARKRLEANLLESEEKFRVLSEAMPQMVWASDRNGRAYYLNSRWLDYTGQTFEEARGLGWLNVLHPEDVPRTQACWSEAVAKEKPYEAEYRIKGKDGRYRWFLSRGLPKRGAAAEIEQWVGTCTDISAQKALEEVLNSAREAAEEATRAKSEFLANMSHEIRTPMTVFMAAVEQLLQKDHVQENRYLLELADASAKRLLNLIEDILDFSRIEARRVEMEEVAFGLRSCIYEAVELFALPAREKNLRLEVQVAPDVPEQVTGDPHRLGQVLMNLVGNAIKFSHRGEIRVAVRPQGRFLEFTVADTGIGIPEEKQKLLFQSFSQADSSLTRRYGGSGLGLAISKGLVELMGGEITVTSKAGEGSVFTFTVPLRISEERVLAQADPHRGIPDQGRAPNILLAEDDPAIREMVNLMLAPRGWQAETAETGRDAFAEWEKGSFDVILMDIQMPEVSGLEATRMIRAREAGQARPTRTRIIGLTAHARREIREEALAAGMDEVLVKPIRMNNLLAAIKGSP